MTKTNPIIEKLIAYVVSECSKIDQERQYNDMLDECYSFEKVGGPFENMSPSRVLEKVDPTAYRCGMNDYFGCSDDNFEIEGELYEKREVEKARESFLNDLDSEIKDLESEIEDEEADEDHNVSELAAKQRKLADLQADHKAVEQYTF